ncbi:CBS domain-containing protein [Rivularia sp. PCC 7116]|uniref:hemolysin family protein n=1 Tax=Rivularia sp. PCC 7116 TaxID=373994 RepID=UPI00029F3026|nr:hemolysin family protein [Rivularia sp. PCC 7116]AFY54487.1 CBS domain-containing protein [Rivularia sp. PCC 7116]
MSLNFELLIIFLLIFANAIFVMSELAIVSARKVRLQQLANQGNTRARAAFDLASSPTEFLGTVQVGITLVTIIAGAYGEQIIYERIYPILDFIPLYQFQVAHGISVLIITTLAIILGELVPKRLALNHPEVIAAIVALPMKSLIRITYPIVFLLNFLTDSIVRLLGIKPSTEPQVTEEEIKVLIEQGTEEGTFEEVEQDMVERVFRLGDRPVGSFMTPRPEIIWLDLKDSVTQNREKIIENGYSRYPVCQEGLDNVLGIIPVTNLLARSFCGEQMDLTVGLREPIFVPESTRGLKVLELFKQTVNHVALVVDEYGVIQGLVTLNDILIEIVGDVPSDEEEEEPQAVKRDDGSWLLDGMLTMDEFFELFDMEEEIESHSRDSYQTLGGLVMTHLGRIPIATDNFEWKDMRFEVMNMDGNRVDKILVRILQNESINSHLSSSEEG